MTPLSSCPDRQSLARLLDPRSKEEDVAPVEEHVLACETCCQALRELESVDTFVEVARGTQVVLPVDEEVQRVMASLKAAKAPQHSPAAALDETLASKCEATEDAWDLARLLDPPEGEGELGRFGGYRVVRVLGAGGMGLVFEAEDPKLRRRVALKVMKRALASHDEHHQRFLREARAAAAIEHPHIVTVYQVGEHNGMPFLAMQLLKGESLDDRLRREREDGLSSPSSTKGDGLGRPSSKKGGLPLGECLRIGRETAEALAEAHERNLIHRDIKPANIWLEGASGWVKLVDFGLAHAAEDVHLTQTGTILGTPAYMSPEQARGDAVDGRTDLHSLGAVLYKLTTGDVPFRGTSTMAVLMALATETPRRPSELNPDIPLALDDLILRLLAKKPGDRFESAAAVAEAIRAIEQEGLKSEVQSPKLEDGARRRRPRGPFVLAAGVAAFMLAAIVIIVRDKHGNELARMKVDGGASVEVLTDEAASKSASPARDGETGPLPETQQASPPPLKEWLQGRTVLTVAQDGSGQFKTILSALKALKPHQVVKVLDRGPYHERLWAGALPIDTGLISEQQAVVELSSTDDNDDYHKFGPFEGFRLSGLRFLAPPRESGLAFFEQVAGLVVEDCGFSLTGPADHQQVLPCALWVEPQAGSQEPDLVVRGCLFDSAYLCLISNQANDNATASFRVERNYFKGSFVGLGSEAIKSVVIRHNVFDGPRHSFDINLKHVASNLDLSNNTIQSANSIIFNFFGHAPLKSVSVRNNISQYGPTIKEDPQGMRAEIIKNWRIDHNAYTRFGSLPKFAGDVLEEPRFVSTNATDRDYLRIPAVGPHASGGAGGEWPTYIGALPPGPAPKEGDWFTRLRERWTEVEWALPTSEPKSANADKPPPAKIAEPPPLEEWLNGREALTVAQDGTGQFKTIQAALDALKPHQVVTILDSGPYHETLNVDGLPDDVGLISKRQATIELTAWPKTPNTGGLLVGHTLNLADGFRLSGLSFVAPAPDDLPGTVRMAQLTRFSGLVIEDCCFGWSGKRDLDRFAQLLQMDNDGGTGVSPVVVRDCLFDSGGVQWDGEEWLWPGTLLVERCFFNKAAFGLGAPQVHNALFRHNVFHGSLWVHRLKKITGTLDISNNTALLGGYLMFNDAPTSGIVLRNNLTEEDAKLGEEAIKVRADIAKNWRRDHNAYALRKYLPKSPTDVTDASGFLSIDPTARDFARIADDGALARGGAGGDWPTYIGALPPGPAPKEGDWFTRLRERWPASRDSDATLPRETIDVLASLDLSKDLVSIANLTGGNNWTKSENKLTYRSDGHSGKIVAPIDLADARDYEIQVDVRRLSGNSVFTLDFPTSATLGSGLDIYIGGQIELKLEGGKRYKIGEWPGDVKDAGQVVMRVHQEIANRPGSVEVAVNDQSVAHWEGNVSKIGNPLESHPAFPGRMTLGLFCFQDSFEFIAWRLRVFDGHAQPLRPTDSGN